MRAMKTDSRYVNRPEGFEDQFNVVFSYEYDQIEEQLSTERLAHLHKALDNLPPRQKEVIFLRFFENLSFEEISAVMGIEQSSVYKIIYKAIHNLQGKLLLEYAVVLVELHSLCRLM
jgi:RNA polymerase sigma factor (sigma-70 family)